MLSMLKQQLKKTLKICIVSLVLALTLSGALGLYCMRQLESLDTLYIQEQKKPYKVEAGMNARIIVDELTTGDYPKIIINLWLKEHPELTAIQKGKYRIDGKKTLAQILQDMVQGNIVEDEYLQLTIVEGSNLAAFNANLKKLLPKQYEAMQNVLSKPADFIIESLKNDHQLLYSIGGAGTSLEGLLMPATYPIFQKDNPLETVATALRSTARFMAASWPDRDADVWVKTPYEALIIASIIERETLVDEERPQVAAVFYNRLKKNMRLQTDPTVMYGVSPAFSGRLSRDQLRKDSPYNTYTRAGLPPTPISMPSKSSILAALHPADSKALYFVAADVSPTQGHVFTNSLDEHNKAVATYRRKVKEYKKNLKNGGADLKEDGDDNFRDLGALDKAEPSLKNDQKKAVKTDSKTTQTAKERAKAQEQKKSQEKNVINRTLELKNTQQNLKDIHKTKNAKEVNTKVSTSGLTVIELV